MSDTRTVWKKLPRWVLPATVVVLVAAAFVVALLLFPPAVQGWELLGNLAAAIVALSTVIVTALTHLAERAEARRRVAAAKAAHPSGGQQHPIQPVI